MAPRKFTSRRKARKAGASKRKVSAPVKMAIAKAVRRIAPGELKFASTWNGQSGAGVSPDTYPVLYNANMSTGNVGLLPVIPQGDDNGMRTGNRISPKRLEVDFWVTARDLTSSRDMVARLLILQSRTIKNQSAVGGISLATVLDYGQLQTDFKGFISNLSGPINKDLFTVLMDRKVIIDKTYGEGPNVGNSYVGVAVGQSPNLIHHIKVVLKPPTTLHYDGAVATLPEGYAPFFNAGYALPSRESPDGPDLTITGLSVYFTSTLYYTDS